MKEKLTKEKEKVIKDFMKTVITPKDFMREEKLNQKLYHNSLDHHLILKSENIEIIFDMSVHEDKKTKELSICVTGTTNYKGIKDNWYTFDRRGIDNSFYIGEYGDKKENANEILKEQIERALEAIERSKDFIKIPEIGLVTTSKNRKENSEKLKKGEQVRLSPGGMGTGYYLRKGISKADLQRGYFCQPKRASKELEKFYEVNPIYISTYDHD